jgi:hypothetical protein
MGPRQEMDETAKIMLVVFVPVLAFVLILLIVTVGAITGGVGDETYYPPPSEVQHIFEGEVAYYEDMFDVNFPSVQLVIANETNSTVAATYVHGVFVTWENSSGHMFIGGNQTAVVVLFRDDDNTEADLRHIFRHELCHHYLASICGIGGNYGHIGWPSSSNSLSTKKLMSSFEEPFCEGYAGKSTSMFYDLTNSSYMDFYDKPLNFFECGFRTCDPEACYND